MESSQHVGCTESVAYWLKNEEDEANNELKRDKALPAIPEPEPPMEVLSRSWTLTASEISKALARKQMQPAFDNILSVIQETSFPPQNRSGKAMKTVGIQTASDLLTLTAEAATDLREEAAMRARLTKEAKRNASISPYEKGIPA